MGSRLWTRLPWQTSIFAPDRSLHLQTSDCAHDCLISVTRTRMISRPHQTSGHLSGERDPVVQQRHERLFNTIVRMFTDRELKDGPQTFTRHRSPAPSNLFLGGSESTSTTAQA